MVEIEFIYDNDSSIITKCRDNERLKDAFEKIAIKNNLKKNSVYFLYNNDKINDKLTINQFINVKVKKFYQKIFLLVKKHLHKLKNIIFLIK